MHKLETFMGGVCKKLFNCGVKEIPVSARAPVLVTQKQFCVEYRKRLTQENLDELNKAFRMLHSAMQLNTKSLFKYMTKRKMRRLFKRELEAYERKVLRVFEKKKYKELSTYLRRHCFAVLSKYLDMAEVIKDPIAVDKILSQIALSHSFITNFNDGFLLHSEVLKTFMGIEFGRLIKTKETQRAMKTYLDLITSRLLIHLANSNDNDLEAITHSMATQRNSIKRRIEKLSDFQTIFVNNSQTSVSSGFALLETRHSMAPTTSRN